MSERLTQFRTSDGIPVSCLIFAEPDEDGIPQILRSVEIEESTGNLILSQTSLDENDVLMIYGIWRGRIENRNLIRIIEVGDLRIQHQKNKTICKD